MGFGMSGSPVRPLFFFFTFSSHRALGISFFSQLHPSQSARQPSTWEIRRGAPEFVLRKLHYSTLGGACYRSIHRVSPVCIRLSIVGKTPGLRNVLLVYTGESYSTSLLVCMPLFLIFFCGVRFLCSVGFDQDEICWTDDIECVGFGSTGKEAEMRHCYPVNCLAGA